METFNKEGLLVMALGIFVTMQGHFLNSAFFGIGAFIIGFSLTLFKKND